MSARAEHAPNLFPLNNCLQCYIELANHSCLPGAFLALLYCLPLGAVSGPNGIVMCKSMPLPANSGQHTSRTSHALLLCTTSGAYSHLTE